MRRIEALFAAAFERRMAGDQRAILEDADRVGEDMDIEDASPGRVRHAVEIAADADHAFVGRAPFEPQYGLIGRERRRPGKNLPGCNGRAARLSLSFWRGKALQARG